jgi:hypothetical protein
MSEWNVTVLRLGTFTKRAKKLFTEAEIEALAAYLSQYPEKGDVIPGTGGLRKIRWSLGNQGKRGGSRVIYYYHHPESLILLLSAYAKSQQKDMDAAEKKMLKAALAQYFEE